MPGEIAKPKTLKERDKTNIGFLKCGRETDLLGTTPKGRTQIHFPSTLNDTDALGNVC